MGYVIIDCISIYLISANWIGEWDIRSSVDDNVNIRSYGQWSELRL